MRTVDLTYPPQDPTKQLEHVCEQVDATLGPSTKLASYPGAQHWHISKHRVKGTLEATWWPSKQRFWLKVATNRDADWIASAIEAIELHFREIR